MKSLTKLYSGGKVVIDDNTDLKTFDWSLIPDAVHVTVQNWFLKTVCIREVLPRIYLDLALVNCQPFMKTSSQGNLMRLAKTVRGIAEPMCSVYTAAYLARIGNLKNPNEKDYLMLLVDFCFKIFEKAMEEGNNRCDSLDEYAGLFEPAIDWIFQCVGYRASKQLFAQVFEMYNARVKKEPIFLQSIIRHFPSDIVASACTTMLACIRDHFPNHADKYRL